MTEHDVERKEPELRADSLGSRSDWTWSRRRGRPLVFWVALATLAALILALGGLFAARKARETHQVEGTVSMFHVSFAGLNYSGSGIFDGTDSGTGCGGVGEDYEDITSNAGVVIFDGAGKVVGSANLSKGRYIPSPDNSVVSIEQCAFTFSLSLPRKDFYRIQLASGKVGGTTMSYEELKRKNWKIALDVPVR